MNIENWKPEQRYRERYAAKVLGKSCRMGRAEKPSLFLDPQSVDFVEIQHDPFNAPLITDLQKSVNAHHLNNELKWLDDKHATTREARRKSGDTNRLVSIRKSPTGIFDTSLNTRKAVFRVYERQWSGEFRVGVESFKSNQEAPAPQQGERFTDKLSNRAVKAITDAGAYVAACKGGFTTFLTLTFDAEARQRLEDGQTIGKEVARFVDGLQKKRARGWTWQPSQKEVEEQPILDGLSQRFAGESALINYVWVAEAPPQKTITTNAAGETIETLGAPNPHVHMLLNWSVEREHFKGWAEQIESLWGNGFATLEKIRDAQSATGYLLKALGYMTKASKDTHTINRETGELHFSQGRIKGNRYGISKGARAPKWECIAEFEAGQMGRFLHDFGKSLEVQQQRIKDELHASAEALKHDKAQLAKAKRIKRAPNAVIQDKISRLTKRLQHEKAHKEQLKAKRRQSAHGGRYRVTFRNESQLKEFIGEAVERAGWRAKSLCSEVAAVSYLANKKLSQWVEKSGQWLHANYRRYFAAVMADRPPPEKSDLIGVYVDEYERGLLCD